MDPSLQLFDHWEAHAAPNPTFVSNLAFRIWVGTSFVADWLSSSTMPRHRTVPVTVYISTRIPLEQRSCRLRQLRVHRSRDLDDRRQPAAEKR
jgi:hypothetical protein